MIVNIRKAGDVGTSVYNIIRSQPEVSAVGGCAALRSQLLTVSLPDAEADLWAWTRTIGRFIEQPQRVFGTALTRKSEDGTHLDVRAWSAVLVIEPTTLTAATGDPLVIASEFMRRFGFTCPDTEAQARWLALSVPAKVAGSARLQLIASPVREDGSTVDLFRDVTRARSVEAAVVADAESGVLR